MYVQKRGNKYRYFKRVEYMGKVRILSVTLDKDTFQARNKAAQMLEELTPVNSDEMDFAALRELFIEDQKVSTKMTTWTRNEGTLKRIEEKLGPVKLNDLTSGTIRRALLELSHEPTTLNEYLKRLKTAIRWAYQNDFIDSTACVDKIKRWDAPTKRDRVKGKYLEKDELNKVIQAASPFYGNIIEFLALSGLRIGELIALQKRDVAPESIFITKTYDYLHDIITPPKTPDSERVVSVQPELAWCIAKINRLSDQHRMISGKRPDYFVVNKYGDRLSYASFCHYFTELTEKTVNKRLTPHSLRHTHASLLAEAGIPLQTISRRLGHHDSRITSEIYTHATKKTAENDRKLIDSVAIIG